ncbi:MAG: hypothetical protein Q9221_006384 [Calogaya cf. arnoldii]
MAEAPTSVQEDFWLFGYGYVNLNTPSPLPPSSTSNPSNLQVTDLETPTAFRYVHASQSRIGTKKPVLKDGPSSSNPKIKESPATSKVTSDDSGKLDHRGTPEHPGRVVTLIDRSHYDSIVSSSSAPAPSYRVWGAAYRIPQDHVKEVQEYLDIREINGYSIQYAPFQPANQGGRPIEKCMVYIGLPSNPQFLGPQDPDRLAARIFRCKGPSGENRDYLFMLEEALKGLGEGAHDEHVEELAKRTRKAGLDRGEDGATLGDQLPIEVAIEQVSSATTSREGMEEVEKP